MKVPQIPTITEGSRVGSSLLNLCKWQNSEQAQVLCCKSLSFGKVFYQAMDSGLCNLFLFVSFVFLVLEGELLRTLDVTRLALYTEPHPNFSKH